MNSLNEYKGTLEFHREKYKIPRNFSAQFCDQNVEILQQKIKTPQAKITNLCTNKLKMLLQKAYIAL